MDVNAGVAGSLPSMALDFLVPTLLSGNADLVCLSHDTHSHAEHGNEINFLPINIKMLHKSLLTATWSELLAEEFSKEYFSSLNKQLENSGEFYPARDCIFRAFNSTPFEQVKVVIIGQDPYPTPGHAHGLAFSVQPDVKPLPKSLKNIFTELEADTGIKNTTGCLLPWAEQGVLLLNAVLTVESGKANSHANLGWEQFTDQVITVLDSHSQSLVFVLWGAYAQKKGHKINRERHLVLESVHPSPLSAYRGFFGSCPFSKINQHLSAQQSGLIDWAL